MASRTMRIRTSALLLIFFSTAVIGDESFWKDENGQPIAETESLRSSNGFGGMLLVTADEDWAEKWATPPATAPHYSTTATVAVGETVMTLIFFANPQVDDEGLAEIRCDLKVTRPGGSISVDARDVECYKGEILGNPSALRMSNELLGFIGEENDERGEWITDIRLTDVVRGVSLDLRARFVLVNGNE